MIGRSKQWRIVVIAAAAAVLLVIVVLMSRADPDEENIFTEDLQQELDPLPNEGGEQALDPAPSEELEDGLDSTPKEGIQGDGGAKLTEDIPLDVESGTIVTPVGAARWVHLSGDSSSVPAGEAIRWPSGFAMFEPPDGRGQGSQFTLLNPARLWVSSDGIDWQLDERIPVPPDAENAQLSFDNEAGYWLVTSSPLRLWHSISGHAWDEYDPSGLVMPIPAGFDLLAGTRFWPVVAEGDIALFTARVVGGFPWADYVPGFTTTNPCVERFREVEPGVFQMVGDVEDGQCPTEPPLLRFEETESGLRVFDHFASAEVGFVDGADLTHIAQIAETDELVAHQVFVIEDGRVSAAAVPWPYTTQVTFYGAQGWIYAYLEPRNGPIQVWRSIDALFWDSVDPPEFVSELGQDVGVHFSAIPGGPLVAETSVGEWETTDGSIWTPAPGELPDAPPPRPGWPAGTWPVRLASGWFANDGSMGGSTDGDDWWIYLGERWFSLEDVGISGHPQVSGGGVRSTAVGNTTIFYNADRNLFGETRNMWILSNEPDLTP